jgi:NADH:ubiquinone reductase (non-electrogenic)
VQDIGLIARRTLRRLPKKTRLKFLASRRRSELARQQGSSSSTQVVQGGNGDAPLSVQSSKPIVLVLGSGWGAHSLIKVPGQIWCNACMMSI